MHVKVFSDERLHINEPRQVVGEGKETLKQGELCTVQLSQINDL